jgi:hypothetical protein
MSEISSETDPLPSLEATGYAERYWDWIISDPNNVHQLDPRDPHGAVEDTLIRAYGHDLKKAQLVSSFALQNVLQRYPNS